MNLCTRAHRLAVCIVLMGQTLTERVCGSAIVAICTDIYGDRAPTGQNDANAFSQSEMTIETGEGGFRQELRKKQSE